MTIGSCGLDISACSKQRCEEETSAERVQEGREGGGTQARTRLHSRIQGDDLGPRVLRVCRGKAIRAAALEKRGRDGQRDAEKQLNIENRSQSTKQLYSPFSMLSKLFESSNKTLLNTCSCLLFRSGKC
jgi:hypothetical protein